MCLSPPQPESVSSSQSLRQRQNLGVASMISVHCEQSVAVTVLGASPQSIYLNEYRCVWLHSIYSSGYIRHIGIAQREIWGRQDDHTKPVPEQILLCRDTLISSYHYIEPFLMSVCHPFTIREAVPPHIDGCLDRKAT